MFHEYDSGGWQGPTGFYHADYRSPPGLEQSKTWDSLYVWAEPVYEPALMPFSLLSDSLYPPPENRRYRLELLHVPADVIGAPPGGTVWDLPLGELFTIELPTYRTTDGLDGYRFSFTISEVIPEPATLQMLVVGVLSLLSRRRSR